MARDLRLGLNLGYWPASCSTGGWRSSTPSTTMASTGRPWEEGLSRQGGRAGIDRARDEFQVAATCRHDLEAWRDSMVTTLLVGGDPATLRTVAEIVLG